jgi:small subunit ribosomal protein S3
MGQKVHPKGFRLAVSQTWDGIWFSKKDFQKNLQEDVKIRELILKSLREALIDRVEIERARGEIRIVIYSAKPGIIIGRAGAGIEDLTKKIKKLYFRGRRIKLSINVKEVKQPSLSARIVGTQIAMDIEKRMPYRRVMKMAIERVMKARAEGVKVMVSGRLNGAEIARTEMLAKGKIPLHTLRADINYQHVMARTIYGAIGVKVWVNRGEVFDKNENSPKGR